MRARSRRSCGALPARSPSALVRADARSPALPAIALPALVRADAGALALFACALDALVRAEAGASAILAPVLPALVRADAGALAILAPDFWRCCWQRRPHCSAHFETDLFTTWGCGVQSRFWKNLDSTFLVSLNGGFEKNSECLVSLANRCSALGREVLTTQRSGAARTTVKKDAGGNAARFGASVRAGAVSRRSRRRQRCDAPCPPARPSRGCKCVRTATSLNRARCGHRGAKAEKIEDG